MIQNFKLKNNLSFKEVELNFDKGLIVFSGPSGSGKSVLMNSILDSLSLSTSASEIVETSISKEIKLSLETVGIEEEYEDFYLLKKIKKEKTRFYIDNQLIPKNKLNNILKNKIKYLKVKDYSDFENKNILLLLDKIISKKNPNFKKELQEFDNLFKEYKLLNNKYQKMVEEEKKIDDIIDYIKYELNVINDVNLNQEEYNNLLKMRNQISNIEKIEEKVNHISTIFDIEDQIYSFLDIVEEDNTEISIALNNLRDIIERSIEIKNDLEEYDIEEILDKIEKYSKIIKKYESIEKAIIYKEEKEKELSYYENITFEKTLIEKKLKDITLKTNKIAMKISNEREKNITLLYKTINIYLKKLYIDNFEIKLEKSEKLNEYVGYDLIKFFINKTELKKISTGEFNRLRLGIMAANVDYSNETGILMLDEIDANLSGEESMSVAEVLKTLSKKYQIFAISHLPQLTATANQHFLVTKTDGISKVNQLKEQDRALEIARLISGKKITEEAINFANKFLNINL